MCMMYHLIQNSNFLIILMYLWENIAMNMASVLVEHIHFNHFVNFEMDM